MYRKRSRLHNLVAENDCDHYVSKVVIITHIPIMVQEEDNAMHLKLKVDTGANANIITESTPTNISWKICDHVDFNLN